MEVIVCKILLSKFQTVFIKKWFVVSVIFLLVGADLKATYKAAGDFFNFIYLAEGVLLAFQVYHYLQLSGFFSMVEGKIFSIPTLP